LFFDNLVVVIGILKECRKVLSTDRNAAAFSQGNSVPLWFASATQAVTQREYVTTPGGVGALAGEDLGLSR
jgi:hypothetical protein